MVVELQVAIGDKENTPIKGYTPKSAPLQNASDKRTCKTPPACLSASAAIKTSQKARSPSFLDRMMQDFKSQEQVAFGPQDTERDGASSSRSAYLGQNSPGNEDVEAKFCSADHDDDMRSSVCSMRTAKGGLDDSYGYDLVDIVREEDPIASTSAHRYSSADMDSVSGDDDDAEATTPTAREDNSEIDQASSNSAARWKERRLARIAAQCEGDEGKGALPDESENKDDRPHPAESFFAELPSRPPPRPPLTANGIPRRAQANPSPISPPPNTAPSGASRKLNLGVHLDDEDDTPRTPSRGLLDDSELDALNATLSPVTPGMREAFGGGYFKEGTDHGVDMYLRACSELATAPISKLVKGAATIIHLQLAHRGIGDRGCVSLAAFLMGNTTVQTIDLEDNNISAQGANALCEAISKNKSVTGINLAGNSLGGAMASVVKLLQPRQRIVSLNLERNKLGDKALETLAAGLNGCNNLLELRLGSNSITDVGFAHLCTALSTKTSLQAVDLEWNSIKDASPLVKCLQANKDLRSVGLRWNKFGSEGCKQIAKVIANGKNATLEHIDMSYNEIGEDACMDVARAIQMSPVLCDVCLSGNAIGENGAIRLLSAIMPNSPLQRIELTSCGLRRSGPLPFEVLCPDAKSPFLTQPNVPVLRELIAELLGTLPLPPKPKPVETGKIKMLSAMKSDRELGWNSNTKLTEEEINAAKLAKKKGAVAGGGRAFKA